MVTEAAPAPNPAQGTETTSIRKADDDGYVRLNALLRRFAARHTDNVTLVDLAAKLCPSGPPCPERVDGLHARPDGRHFTPTACGVGRPFRALGDSRDLPSSDARLLGRLRALSSRCTFPPRMIAVGGWAHRWMDEDAFINLRIVDQIFAGHGPVFNAGERIEAATSPLWLAILVVGRAFFGLFVRDEWIAVLASLLAAVAAFALGGRAARLLHRDEDGVVVPVGLILVAAVAVVWDFSTSGLEMGLVWLWLATAWFVLVSVARSEEVGGRRRFGFGVVLGLAPLVRPDLGLMMLCVLVAWFMLVRPRRIVFDLVAIFALPLAYQIFRMGYYASLVPSTALAKDAGRAPRGPGVGVRQGLHRRVPPVGVWPF